MAAALRDRKTRPRTGSPDDRLEFLRGFLTKPKEVGSIIPSSRFLERRIIRCADVSHAKVVVELGPGTGGTTRALLRAMAPDARLVAALIGGILMWKVPKLPVLLVVGMTTFWVLRWLGL